MDQVATDCWLATAQTDWGTHDPESNSNWSDNPEFVTLVSKIKKPILLTSDQETALPLSLESEYLKGQEFHCSYPQAPGSWITGRYTDRWIAFGEGCQAASAYIVALIVEEDHVQEYLNLGWWEI